MNKLQGVTEHELDNQISNLIHGIIERSHAAAEIREPATQEVIEIDETTGRVANVFTEPNPQRSDQPQEWRVQQAPDENQAGTFVGHSRVYHGEKLMLQFVSEHVAQDLVDEIHAAIEQDRQLREQAEELRKGDNKLIRTLAEDAGIKITASDKLLGVQWEQFHAGVMSLHQQLLSAQAAIERAKKRTVDFNIKWPELESVDLSALQKHDAEIRNNVLRDFSRCSRQ